MAGKKARKAEKSVSPKTVGGHKMPKALRKFPLLTQISQNALAREVCAAGLMAAAAALMKNGKVRQKVSDAASRSGPQAAELASCIGRAVIDAIGNATDKDRPRRSKARKSKQAPA